MLENDLENLYLLKDLNLVGDLDRLLERYRVFRHRLIIDGVEVTQGVQFYHANQHLTDRDDRGTDNSLRLVANKPAWVRVYIHSAFEPVSGVNGTLEVSRATGIGGSGFLYKPVSTLLPQPGSITTAQTVPTYLGQRDTISSTVNFVIPSDVMFGFLRLKVKVTGGSFGEEIEVDINVELLQTLSLAGIMVSYNGPDGIPGGTAMLNLPAPGLADLERTGATTSTLFPVEPDVTVRTAGVIVNFTLPLNDMVTAAGNCSPNWYTLITTLAGQRTNDGNRNNVIYYGLLPNGIPVGNVAGTVVGCEDSGVGAGVVDDGITMAHEIGHFLGLQHGPCGAVGTTADPSYPLYEPYGNSSIGEFGLDINNGNIQNPNLFFDFMSYCFPKWISIYHHKKLIRNTLLNPRFVGGVRPDFYYYLVKDPHFIPDPWPPDHLVIPKEWLPEIPSNILNMRKFMANPQHLISIIGTISLDKLVKVDSVAQIEAYANIPGSTPTEYLAELIDRSGQDYCCNCII